MRTLLMDMDGVIVDSEKLHEDADRVAFKAYGLQVPEEEFAQMHGVPAIRIFEDIAQRYGTPDLDWRAMLRYKHQWFRTQMHQIQPIEGVLAFIPNARQAGLRIGLVTSSGKPYQQFIFEKFRLHDHFDHVVTIEDVTHGKPHPEPYRTGAARFGALPANCWVIEDAPSGVQAAREAGCRVIGITSTVSHPRLEAAGAHHIFSDYQQISHFLLGK